MKKILCILLMLLLALPALAEEENAFVLDLPEGVTLEEKEGSMTFVEDTARVVAIIITRVPDEDPAAAVIRLMGQFDPEAVIGEDIAAVEGFHALQAVTADKFGEGVDCLTVMILSDAGELLILSAHDMSGDETKAQALLDAVLAGVQVHDEKILTEE